MHNPAERHKALADETRYALLLLLLQHDFCVKSLSRQLGVTESAVSQHLKILKGAGLVMGEKRGYFTHYRVDRTKLAQIGEELVALAQTPAAILPCSHVGEHHHNCHERGK
jgi:ArsR family transcriptional regulator, arsenate/arsenite/antimonite-responsive transcriptional repressor